ncbi:hypothetical protein P8452_40381 [Trifolium repens]|nr:hypothetical protein P8452_40381 [Trifolium repens]
MMLDPVGGGELVARQSSPTNSSISSSDLDTESTGSFFHDRSTTLGTLMGLTFTVPSHQPSITANSKRKNNINSNNAPDTVVSKRRRRWWHFCSHIDARSASLAQFLEVERRFGDAAFYVEGLVAVDSQQQRDLFADGRVLPPSAVDDGPPTTTGTLCSRFPVSLNGICNGGAG